MILGKVRRSPGSRRTSGSPVLTFNSTASNLRPQHLFKLSASGYGSIPLESHRSPRCHPIVLAIRRRRDGDKAEMKDSLDPLEHLVREVFHRIVHNRTEGLDSLLHNPE